jgi:soluble lytic murein transglycosylase
VSSRKKRGASGKLIAVLVIICIAAATFIFKDSLDRSFFYPDDYCEEIIAAAQANNIDINLLFAVVREESRFKENALSTAGAQGLMQLMPETASWICQKASFDYDSREAVWDPAANIMMGAWYLKWLSDTYYEGNIAAAIAAYNAGQQNVNGWLQEGLWDGSLSNAADIPFTETSDFLQSVNKSYQKYSQLYDFASFTTGFQKNIFQE